jgi:hypothetical protein
VHAAERSHLTFSPLDRETTKWTCNPALVSPSLTRNGEPEAVLLSVDDIEGLEMTLKILGDADAVARISESLAALERGEPAGDMATVRQDLARLRATGR